MKIYTYRYMWQVKANPTINFKVVTDTEKGLLSFEEALKKIDGLSLACKEYLNEYDIDKITRVEKLFSLEDNKGGDNNETTADK